MSTFLKVKMLYFSDVSKTTVYISCAINLPAKQVSRAEKRFSPAFKPPVKYLPSEIKETVSKLNVENVVSPPKIPVVRKIRTVSGIGNITLASIIKPMINPPTTFTRSVPKGKSPKDFAVAQVTMYLNAAPINPPTPTAKSLLILIFTQNSPIID